MRIAKSFLLGTCLSLFVAAADATLISTGADGSFHPTASVALDVTQQVFNFTDILIPAGVAVTFSGLSPSQPVELLATGNIDIAGLLDAGMNNLLIETPGTISLTGSLTAQGGTITIVSEFVAAGGTPQAGNCPGQVATGSLIMSRAGGVPTQLQSPCVIPSPSMGNGGLIQPGAITLLDPRLPSTIPEPGTLALLALGLATMTGGRQRHAAARR